MTDLARAESCGTGQVGRQINVQHKFRSNFCAFQLSLSMIKFWCVFPPPPYPFVSCSCVRKWPKPAELSSSPVNPIAIRNIRGNHFANAARPQLAFCCGVCVCVWKRGGGGEGLLLSLRVPYFILIYSVVHAYFRYGLPRRIHAFPSGWLGSFGSTIAWLQQLCHAPAHVTAHLPSNYSVYSL